MKPMNLQEQKVKFAELMEEFAEIKNPKRYHHAAFRYGVDNITTRVSEYLTTLTEVLHKLTDEMKKRGDILEDLPPAISQKIDEIVLAAEEANPDITQEEKDLLVAFLFMPDGVYGGVYDDNGKINQTWVQEHLNDEDNWPEILTIPFTPEMAEDALAIIKGDGENAEKHDKISALFRVGGKYEGYVQADGGVDEAKIVKRK